MKDKPHQVLLRDLLISTKDGDWGNEHPTHGYMPYRVIRGTDFPSARVGQISSIPLRYLSESTVYRRALQCDDILIETAGGSSDRPTGRTLLINHALLENLGGRVTCASFARFLRIDKSKANARFVYWYLQHLYASGQMEAHQVQHTGVARFQYTRFAETELISLPSRSQQDAIAHILGTLDDKIELNRRMNETLEAMARALFKSWFVDFDPVHRNIQRAQGHTPPNTKLAEFDALFPDALEESELGDIPKAWSVNSIGDLADIVGGSTPSTKEPRYWKGGTHHWATPKDLSSLNSPILLHTERCVSDAGLAQISSGLLPQGSVLFSSRAPIGYLAIAEIPVAINQGFIAMTPKGNVSNIFLLLWAREAKEAILSRANGSTFQEISKSNFRPIRLVSPLDNVLNAFDRLSRPMYRLMVKNQHEIQLLAILRDGLLPKLVSGELNVRSATRVAEVPV